jgi:hypothetical protein
LGGRLVAITSYHFSPAAEHRVDVDDHAAVIEALVMDRLADPKAGARLAHRHPPWRPYIT